MSKAWLDSLSEDWISQPRSEGSPNVSPPSLSQSNPASESSLLRKTSSRIPLYSSRKGSDLKGGDSSLPLGERSTNKNNIPRSQRSLSRSSKVRSELGNCARGRQLSRAISASSIESIQRNTVQHKSFSLSPQKPRQHQETPEWKKRLLQGDLPYGDQRDLFAPISLESVFKPPLHTQPEIVPVKRPPRTDGTPTPFLTLAYLEESQTQRKQSLGRDTEETTEGPTCKERREVKYKFTDSGTEPFSDEISKSSSFHFASLNVQKIVRNPEPGISFKGLKGESRPSILSNGKEHAGQRISSRNSDARYEDLSPILISRHNTSSGSIGYAVTRLPSNQLRGHSPEPVDNESPHHQDELSTASGDVIAHTNNAISNIQKEEGLEEGSFQGKMLSSPLLPAVDESGILQEASVEASTPKLLPNMRKTRASSEYPINIVEPTSPPVPPTPFPSPAKEETLKSKSGSGSPLKLFGTYDTFTNQKLLRRLSQFEDNLCGEEDVNTDGIRRAKTIDPGIETTHNTAMNDAYIETSNPSKSCRGTQNIGEESSLRKLRAFGYGDLDDFEFSEESLPCGQEVFDENKGNRPASSEDSTLEKKLSSHLDSSRILAASQLKVPSLQTDDGESESKRLPRSPLRDPTPKRRRTLREMDISQFNLNQAAVESTKESHQQMQSVVGKKRKDARHGDGGEPANPEVLATRQILRPRTHHLSNRTSQDYSRTSSSDAHMNSTEEAGEKQDNTAKVESGSGSITAAKFVTGLVPGNQMENDSRKGSVTTQDFLDEAKKIMAGIRGKARMGLFSVRESEGENEKYASGLDQEVQDDSYEESTMEPFSRPPSREGGPLPRLQQKQHDPEILKHLRMYEEISDMDIASSLKPIHPAGDIFNGTTETADDNPNESVHLGASYQSDPPGIRISENPEMQRKRKHSISSGPSSGKSIPTSSSGGSDSKRGMLPHTIASIIPEQAAGMVFDREKMAWVKRRLFNRENEEKFLSSDDTEEDPFCDIPDLSIDETLELQRMGTALASQKDIRTTEIENCKERYDNVAQNAAANTITDAATVSKPAPQIPCITAQESQQVLESDEQTHLTRGREDPVKETLEGVIEDVEQEISINESRAEPQNSMRRRNVTIAFSSPIASIIEPDGYNHGSWGTDEDSSDGDSVIVTEQRSIHKIYGPKSRPSHSSHHSGSRRLSVGGRAFLPRPVSRIDEREEEFFTERTSNNPQEHGSVSITISTPLPTAGRNDRTSLTAPPSVSQRPDSLLQLTPLSEFTMHQRDESFALEVSYVGQQTRRQTSNSQRTLSLSVKDLVESITDIEPFEPFWEHIKRIKLCSKRLRTLHMLGRFCGRLEELDVSQNELSHLDGVPGTVRHLRITHNLLSDLTSWGHLSNLQYIDVSKNGLTSLDCFVNLIHLRALRADNNNIQSIEGVMHLDGLLSLRLGANSLEAIDFAGSSLQRLTELDLRENRIREICNLQELRSLTTLNLEDNDLCELASENNDALWTLKYLRLSGNRVEYLDVSRFPNLRLLYLDRNCIGKVSGFFKTNHLDSLSMREQQNGSTIDSSFLNEAFEIRKLFLSGNLLTTFTPSVDFLNLQYLELANCGIEQLHPEFGQMMSNLRTLNLNFNALYDITPLLGIVRLKTLHLAGNRLSRLRRIATVLSRFLCLRKLDLRSNPLTIGFYPPVLEKRIIFQNGANDDQETLRIDPFTLSDAERESDVAYESRLDMETKMRRRIFELLIVGGCGRLKVLDGLEVKVNDMVIKDKVWEELVKLGLIHSTGTEVEDTVQSGTDKLEQSAAKIDLITEMKNVMRNGANEEVNENSLETNESLWPAEDSFA